MMDMRKMLVLLALVYAPLCCFSQGYNSRWGSHKGYASPGAQQQVSSWSGSGIAIGQRLVATNHHVVDGATNMYMSFSEAEVQYKAETVVYDEVNDLAIVRVTDPEFPGFGNIEYGFKRDVEDIGVGVFVLGYPMVQTMGSEIKLTTGVVSSRSGYEGNKSQYQVSAPVQPGNSGGPLFNQRGELIGIVSAKHVDAENVSYGVKLEYLYALASGVNGVQMNKTSQIANLRLSDKCKAIIPFTVMLKADNTPAHDVTEADVRPSSGMERTYPLRINRPEVEDGNTETCSVIGIEMTDRYTAIHLSMFNTLYETGHYNVNAEIYVRDPSTGTKYGFLGADNCAVSPELSSVPARQRTDCVLYFEPVPLDVDKIDMIEPGYVGWKYYGINLK